MDQARGWWLNFLDYRHNRCWNLGVPISAMKKVSGDALDIGWHFSPLNALRALNGSGQSFLPRDTFYRCR